MKLYRGVPVVYGGGSCSYLPKTTIRITVETKEKLQRLRNKLQRDHWEHISYSNTIEYLLSK